MYRGISRYGIDKRLIAVGVKRKRSNRFIANEVRSKIKMDRKKIIESYIRCNRLDITLNDKIIACKAQLDKLRILEKLN